jgi:hypothetical protein
MSKRVVTSAIEGMTVSRVRRGLDAMRKQWRERSDERPFFICHTAVEHMSMQHFAFKFVMGHHYKRHSKSKHVRDADADADAYADLDADIDADAAAYADADSDENDHGKKQKQKHRVVAEAPRARGAKRLKKQV